MTEMECGRTRMHPRLDCGLRGLVLGVGGGGAKEHRTPAIGRGSVFLAFSIGEFPDQKNLRKEVLN